MKFLDARIRIQHPCPFCDFSKEFPDMEMSTWCNVDREVMQVVALNEEQLKDIISRAKEIFGAKPVASSPRSALLVTSECMCDEYNSIDGIADKYGSWSVPPTIYFGGWETHRLISHNRAALKKFANKVKKIGKIEIASVRERMQLDMLSSLGVVPIHFFNGLTNKQLRVVVSAYENGLLEVPAKTRMDRIAKVEGLSRSTYGEHLRKAVHRIIENSYPMLKLYDERAGRVAHEG